MCEKCNEMWDAFKKKEKEYQQARQAYLDQAQKLCDEKEHVPEEKEETHQISEDATGCKECSENRELDEHGFCKKCRMKIDSYY